jgi:hypothetical protein
VSGIERQRLPAGCFGINSVAGTKLAEGGQIQRGRGRRAGGLLDVSRLVTHRALGIVHLEG